MNIGKRIKEERLRLSITQKELAESASLSTSYICDIEVGRTNPSLKTLMKLSSVLNVGVDKLMKDN